MLDELFLCQFYLDVLVAGSGKIGLSVLHCFLEVLESLFVGVDQHLVIKLELKLHARNDS